MSLMSCCEAILICSAAPELFGLVFRHAGYVRKLGSESHEIWGSKALAPAFRPELDPVGKRYVCEKKGNDEKCVAKRQQGDGRQFTEIS